MATKKKRCTLAILVATLDGERVLRRESSPERRPREQTRVRPQFVALVRNPASIRCDQGEIMEMDFQNAGVSRHIEHHVESPAWVSEDLLAETRRVWSQAYDREIDQFEALEILGNVRRLGEVLWKARQTGVAA